MEQLKKVVEFLKSIKELAAVLIGIGVIIVASVNYFVTRGEMKQLQCQLMDMMEVANYQIIILNGRRDEDQQAQDIAMYNSLTAPTPEQLHVRDLKRQGLDNLEKTIAALDAKVIDTRAKLEHGECYTGASDDKIKKLKDAAD